MLRALLRVALSIIQAWYEMAAILISCSLMVNPAVGGRLMRFSMLMIPISSVPWFCSLIASEMYLRFLLARLSIHI